MKFFKDKKKLQYNLASFRNKKAINKTNLASFKVV
jgi:hypothetical protein